MGDKRDRERDREDSSSCAIEPNGGNFLPMLTQHLQ
jgi:hypothetical protein